MKKLYLRKNVAVILCMDVLLFCGALCLSYLLRFDFDISRSSANLLWHTLPFAILTKLAVFYFFDLYRGMWRYTSIGDLLNIVKASFLSSLLIVGAILFINRFEGFPRSVFLVDCLLTILLISGFRVAIRFYFEHAAGENIRDVAVSLWKQLIARKKDRTSKGVIIIGAGDGGEKIYREIRNNPLLGYNVVGFLDDNPVKIGMKIHGIPVLGPIAYVETIKNTMRVDEIVIAIPSASADQMRTIVTHCEKSGVSFKTVPGYAELINGKVSISSIRNVAYRDLLGRDVVNLDKEKIGAYLRGKNVLVTGAGGSIGSELCRQVGRFHPGRIILFERSETALYEIDLELKSNFKEEGIDIVPILGDVQDRQQLEQVFARLTPDVVFHAAAYKHVPILESHPWKAVKNNICGTQNLVEVSKKFDVDRFVFVSTDKAVRPSNVMGASKRVAEILLQSQNGCNTARTQFMIVRFGNVAGSAGSVIPLFKKQIEKGGPVTVTHPDVTRYFMTISEACQLILQAGAIGNKNRTSAEVFLLKMGTPIKIADMARDLIRLSGFEPDVDIKIEYIGLRPGEKLYEELITEGEGIVPTDHEKIMVLRGVEKDLVSLNGNIDKLIRYAESQDVTNIRAQLKGVVPEYAPALNSAHP
ncbi:MAG: nucleoside-diphosphate sugar epimerase/dehydratase [Thermodesulfobacteriota bacterium]|nr:nucleoside-diphosphate sugar epimerase/dehydratase [Thermodesulfobacteriota bacterium]